ncbi:PIN domain-containing protein [Microbacterium sp. NPDC097977]|uniref:PIN domain-containing protein n=1 Tax=Microbacterium sp. NPDC097977 TaxID=3155686 RepID=UPI00332FD52B
MARNFGWEIHILVIVDANILIQDPLMRERKWDAARSAINAGRLRLVLPEVARREAIGGFRRDHLDKIRQIRSVLRKSSANAKRAADALLQTYTDEVLAYESILDSRIEALGIEVVPLPDVDHIELTQRAINRVPPFDESGGGYRDSLIWLTALAQVDEPPFNDVTILSKDSIFAKRRKSLQEESRREVGAAFVVVNSLAAMEFPGEYEAGEYSLGDLDIAFSDIVDEVADALHGLDISRWAPPGPDHAVVQEVGRVDLDLDTIEVKKRYHEDVYEIRVDGIADIDATVFMIYDLPGDEVEMAEMSARWNLLVRWRGEAVGESTRLQADGTIEVLGLEERRRATR